jgi:hypothetical protein
MAVLRVRHCETPHGKVRGQLDLSPELGEILLWRQDQGYHQDLRLTVPRVDKAAWETVVEGKRSPKTQGSKMGKETRKGGEVLGLGPREKRCSQEM